MQPQAILYHLAHAEGLPEDVIRAARAQRAEVAPIFVDFVERYLAGEARAGELQGALFFVFHLLGEWWERSAYRLAGISGAAGVRLELGLAERALNPFRGIGRNDPCPCGSGKKFKRCCLQ
jgi:hypothetical protein